MALEYKQIPDVQIQDDSHNLVMESAPSPTWEWTPSGHTLESVDKVGSGFFETFGSSFWDANIMSTISNMIDKPGVVDPWLTKERSLEYIAQAESIFGPLSDDQKKEFIRNVTSEADFQWQLEVYKNRQEAQRLAEGSPVASALGSLSGGFLDPSNIIGGIGGAKTIAKGAQMLKMGKNTFGIPAGALMGASGGYIRADLEAKYKGEESVHGFYSAVGAIGGAIAGANGITGALYQKYKNKNTVTGLPKSVQNGLSKWIPEIGRFQSMYDTLKTVDPDMAQQLFGGSSEGKSALGAIAESLAIQREMYPELLKFEKALKDIDGMFEKGIWDRINPAEADARAIRSKMRISASKDAKAYLIDLNEYEKYIATLEKTYKDLEKAWGKVSNESFDLYKGAHVFGEGTEAIEQAMQGHGKFSYEGHVGSLRDAIEKYNFLARKMNTDSGVSTFKQIDIPDYLSVPRTKPTLPQNEMSQQIIKAYQDSNLGAKLGELVNKRSTLPKVHVSKNYMHLSWDADELERRILDLNDAQAVSVAFGRQILAKIKPERVQDDIMASKMGALFLSGVISNHKGNAILTSFIQKTIQQEDEELIELLYKFSGDSLPESLTFSKLLESIMGIGKMPNAGAIGQSSLFQHRFPWDLGAESDGGVRLRDFISPDVYRDSERTVLETARRVALSTRTFTDPLTGEIEYLNSGATLEKVFRKLRGDLANKYSTEEADRVTEMARSMLLGQPYGEQLSTFMRSMANIAQAMHLAKSGIYNIGDYANLMSEYGTVGTIKAFVPALKKCAGRDLKDFSKQDAKDLADWVSDNIAVEGRVRPRVNIQSEDFYDAPTTQLAETIEYATQYVRFLNGSEYIRRHQVQMASTLYQRNLIRASRDINSPEAQYLLKQGMSKFTRDRILRQVREHGVSVNKWKDKGALAEAKKFMEASVDDTILTIRSGERPLIMETALGKVIFAYQSFVFASHNKLLRRKYNQEGFYGVAYLMTSQLPLAVMATVASNIIDGKDPFSNMGPGVSNSMSSLGIISMATNAITRGELGGTFPGLAPATALVKLPTEIAEGDPVGIVKCFPWLATSIAVRGAVGAYASMTE